MAIVPWTEQEKIDFLRMQHHAQHTFYHSEYPRASYDILIRRASNRSRLYVDRRGDHLSIMDIALPTEPQCRNWGGLVRDVMRDAAAAGLARAPT